MKKMKITYLAAALMIGLGFSSCVSDEDQNLPEFNPVVYYEDFHEILEGTFDDTPWTFYAEAGTKNWKQTVYKSNGYFEFSPFQSGENLNVAWLVTPPIAIENAKKKRLTFEVAQHHVVNTANNFLKAYISTDFSGDVATATWVEVPFRAPGTKNYEFSKSGVIDLSGYQGPIYIGFKGTGGTASANAGSYMIDNIRVF